MPYKPTALKKLLTLSSLFFLILSASCAATKVNFAPSNLKGVKVNYYSSQVVGPADQSLLGKWVLYYFKEDGTYDSYLDNQPYQFGDYSYDRTSPVDAQVAISYSESKATYTYVFVMHFKNKSSGTWKTIYTTECTIEGVEKGTFKILNTSDPS